jgi:hypothetical protein
LPASRSPGFGAAGGVNGGRDDLSGASLDARRGHRPRLTAPGTGRRPVLTLADRFLATVLHQRLALPQVAIAALFSVRPATINKRIRDIKPGRSLPARGRRRHRHPTGDQDSVLMVCERFRRRIRAAGSQDWIGVPGIATRQQLAPL